MARPHKHNWRFVRANPPMSQMGGAVAEGATLWACTGCSMTQVRPGPGGMRIVGAGGPEPEVEPAAESVPAPQVMAPAPPKGWLGTNISLAVGYTRADGTNEVTITTPPAGLNRRQLLQAAQGEWATITAAGTPVWAESQPDTLAADVIAWAATQGFALTQGWQDGWLPDPTPPVDPNAPVDAVIPDGPLTNSRLRSFAIERGWYAEWDGGRWVEGGERPDLNRAHAMIETGEDRGPGASGG